MATSSISITLTGEAAERVERLVKSGEYPTPEAAVQDALAALEGESPNLDAWLNEAAVRYEQYQSDPSRGVSLEEARKRLLGDR